MAKKKLKDKKALEERWSTTRRTRACDWKCAPVRANRVAFEMGEPKRKEEDVAPELAEASEPEAWSRPEPLPKRSWRR